MIGILTIVGIIGLALTRKRSNISVSGISKYEWLLYRDLIDQIETALEQYVWDNADSIEYNDAPLYERPRLDISIMPGYRTDYFDVTIDDYSNFKYPNKTYDINLLINEELESRDNPAGINYEELEYLVNDLLDYKFGKKVSGIGAAYKRRIYGELASVNNLVDFSMPYEDQSQQAKRVLESNCNSINKKYPNRQPITVEKYFRQLKRAYNAISGIGATNLPYKQYDIYNHRGDLILTHRDYGTPEEQFQDAIDYIELSRANSYEDLGFWDTIIAIATGTKFVWSSSGSHRGIESLVFGTNAPAEKKQRISYLATPQKNGIYPEAFAHKIWEKSLDGDDMEILNGVLEALRTVTSVKEAKKMIIERYEQDHEIQSDEFDTPF